MSYEKQTWNKYDELKTEEENIENGAVVTDNRMNHMETGIGDNDANLASHLADKNNPHKVTAAQVGLGNVQNFGLATEDEAKQGISNAKYMTPSLTQAVLSANINSTAYANSADGTDGFTTVYPNLNLLSQNDLIPGYLNDKGVLIPPSTGVNERTSPFLEVDASQSYTAQVFVTLAIQRSSWFGISWFDQNQIFIKRTVFQESNVPISGNYTYHYTVQPPSNAKFVRISFRQWGDGKLKLEPGSTATPWMPSASEVTTADWPKYVGFSNTVKTNKSASDYTWFPVKDSELTNKVDSHIKNKANPHSVTASQVGAYSKDESDQKLAAQKQAIDSHVNNKANPHAVTASQVGAYSKQEIDTKLSKAVMADDSGKVSIGTLDSNTLTVQGTKIYPNTKDGVWTVERLFDNEYRLTTVMSVSEAVTNAWGALFISPEVSHPTLPSGYNKNSWSANLSNSTNLMWCSISGASAFRLIAGASTSAATRTVIVTVYASK